MNKYSLILSIFTICFIVLAITKNAYPQAPPDKNELQELKQMIQELKNENEERNRELEKLKKENAEKIQSLEKRIDELTAEQSKTFVEGEEEQEEQFTDVEDERDIDEDDLLERINAGDKPYKKLFDDGPFELEWGGYADILFSWYGYGPDQTRPGGSGSDNRLGKVTSQS